MAKLQNIPGLDEKSHELLEAAGFTGLDALARVREDELLRELERANAILRIAPAAPSRAQVQGWIREARDAIGMGESHDLAAEEDIINYEQDPDIVASLAQAPYAIPLPARVLIASQVSVADIPPALLLNQFSGEFDLRAGKLPLGSRKAKAATTTAAYVRIADGGSARQEIDNTRLRSTTEAAKSPPPELATVKVSPSTDRVALIRAPRASTNQGRNPESRFYIRGVLHSHPMSVKMGALVTICVMIMIPLAVVSALLLLLSGELPRHFAWVPGWLIAFPLVLPLFGLAYMIWGLGASCRICGHKLFRNSAHFKHKRAHHLPLMGYVLPLCLHILLFKWFRCTHCGTPVRLKE